MWSWGTWVCGGWECVCCVFYRGGVITSQWSGMWGQEWGIEASFRLRIMDYLPNRLLSLWVVLFLPWGKHTYIESKLCDWTPHQLVEKPRNLDIRFSSRSNSDQSRPPIQNPEVLMHRYLKLRENACIVPFRRCRVLPSTFRNRCSIYEMFFLYGVKPNNCDLTV
jgi:hypothetical protein